MHLSPKYRPVRGYYSVKVSTLSCFVLRRTVLLAFLCHVQLLKRLIHTVSIVYYLSSVTLCGAPLLFTMVSHPCFAIRERYETPAAFHRSQDYNITCTAGSRKELRGDTNTYARHE